MTRVQRVAQPPHALATHGAAPACQASAKAPYVVQEKPLGRTKHVRIVCIGAGASGLNMIRTLRRNLTDYELVVYEKNGGVGGTWFENQYPGCRCDVPSHNYQFSWRPNPEWSNFFSSAEEIHQYLCRVCEEENMGDTIKTRHQVIGAWWDEARGVWDLKVRDLASGKEIHDHANFVIDGSGILKYVSQPRATYSSSYTTNLCFSNWKWPDITGLHEFRGELIHTARWPKGMDLTGKTVAVIGNGSSGVQLVPTIQPGEYIPPKQ